MNAFFATTLMVCLALAFAGEWWRIRRQCQARIREAQSRQARDRLRADECLAAAKRQIASLQHQLVGARARSQQMERQPVPAPVDRSAQRSYPGRSPLLMLDDDFPDRSQGGFADTTVGR